ncbi:MAG: reverse transcriptase domain-containing protein [Victivallaceae bacterium]|jgi:retron-type reverse transcriptase
MKTVQARQLIIKEFVNCFSEATLRQIYNDKIFEKKSAGLDGIDCELFEKNKDTIFATVCRKIDKGTYAFTPYSEVQLSKGRGKPPRILALPTLRDQLTLSCLKEYLHANFEKSVNRKLPNSYIFELNKIIAELNCSEEHYSFIKTDITGFYDNLDREKLMNFVRRDISNPQALKLIYRSITNPTIPRDSAKHQRYRYLTSKGVPQGLAISNILANIYMQDFDKLGEVLSTKYQRYVDDIIVICPKSSISKVLHCLHIEIAKLGLEFNADKTEIGCIGSDAFDFLGYRISKDSYISVRESSIQRLIKSIARKLVYADHHRDNFLELHTRLKPNAYKTVLMEDLNERITGAVSDKRLYGWLFYFSQITDLALLHKLDRIVGKLCMRCITLDKKKPIKVKSFVKTFREIHQMRINKDFNSEYIPNYNNFDFRRQRQFLRFRGLLADKKRYSQKEINDIFVKTITARVKSLDMDIKEIS